MTHGDKSSNTNIYGLGNDDTAVCLCCSFSLVGAVGESYCGHPRPERARGTTKHLWESDLDRIEGELRRMQEGASAYEVEACFARAVERSHQQRATSLELRAATSLARLWRDQGKRDEARELLAPVYGWFTEGFDTLDLKQAKALLEELAA
jgi:predicted ATPase